MPAVVDKARKFSLQRKQSSLRKSYHSGKKHITKLYQHFNFHSIITAHRLVYQAPDMPRSGSEKQAIVTRTKRSSESPEPVQNRDSRTKQSSGGSRKSQVRKDQESGQGQRGSPASVSGQVNLSAPSRRLKVAEDCTNLINVPLPVTGVRQAADLREADVEPTNPSAAYLKYCIGREVKRRKQAIVDRLMAVITECVEQRLEALEEGCDQTSGSHSSSRAAQAGKPISRSAGQKRSKGQSSRDESENDEEEGGGDSRRKRDSKRTKTTKDDTRPRFACPYHQHNPARFGAERTCCGPGWTDISRVKEHLERRHSLPSHQCLRCLLRFNKPEALKQHQRTETPCPVKEPGHFKRDLSDGYDEEQAEKLKGRPRLEATTKWKEWYGILFNVKPDSPDIPSPYYDNSVSGAKLQSTNPDEIERMRKHWVEAKPAVRQQIAKTVSEAFIDCAPQLKINVVESLQEALPRILAGLLPYPGLDSEETSNAADTLGLFDLIDPFNSDLYEEEPFDFHDIDQGVVIQDPFPPEFSEFSDSSDTYQAGDSSATSVGDDASYQQFDTKFIAMPQNLDFSVPGNCFY
ncbi:uncharacterized protein B0J16DRAFT_366530 [Fusarium flagelliforme]|uniref:C2H2-type domain-containing protein n=1 Tax=Fusarium flagelliforme TaxID=2675880 RepID=A0A395MZL6_9HYPO|nr:uncharacterized protein B0J16DRAFT_366530 [Fusarium flagelliforme]KAH7197304.1 hypothetical protein B0J16DRAFT_366530 [Fusarium flagelliforme]RFN53358.1 hypothetical protein FIE12Z_2353 [Fusarium flagelliforme]